MSAMVRLLLRYIFSKFQNDSHHLSIEFADGSKWRNYQNGEPEILIRFKTAHAEWYSLVFFYEGFFEKYIDGEIDLIGQNPASLLFAMGKDANVGKPGANRPYVYAANPLMVPRKLIQEWLQSNKTRAVAKKNAEFHYAIHPKLFEEMLGETVGYSEGYWVEGTQNINQAKHNNSEYICRKLLLKPGDRVLEVGAGWGYTAIYMVKNYGVTVTVYNPVKRQNEYMRERFERHDVAGSIRIVEGDHRDIVNEPKGSFDKFLTIGVHEHHGLSLKRYDEWWTSIEHSLKLGGIGVISTSSLMQRVATSFLALKYIFPGGHLPSLPHELITMNKHDITLIEIENLWPHYQRTLRVWRERFNLRWPDIQKADPTFFTERFRRSWSMYLDSTVEVFNETLDLSHIIFVRGRSAEYYPRPRESKPVGDFRTDDQGVEFYR
jgi:cyclopropane-fatty-acyl-phospholipid synthase